MNYTFSKEQIGTAKKIVGWLMNMGMNHEQARREALGIILGSTVKVIENALRHSGCTNLKNLKLIIRKKETLDKERYLEQ